MDLWIPSLNLSFADKDILQSQQWINDAIIYGAQTLLKRQCDKTIHGWQSTQLSKRESLFTPLPPGVAFVQVMHTSNSHWILVSNVLGREHSNDIVNIYDSLYSTTVSAAIKKQVCSFMKPMVDSLRFDIMNIECQTNS